MPGVCPRRKIPDFLGPDLHPAEPNDDVSPSSWPSWLSSTPATTPINGDRGARPPTFKGDSRKTSKKTQAPHTGENLQEDSGTTHRGGAVQTRARVRRCGDEGVLGSELPPSIRLCTRRLVHGDAAGYSHPLVRSAQG
jgi:hypothetical protein